MWCPAVAAIVLQADLVALKTRAAELDQKILLREAEAASQQEQFLARDDREAVWGWWNSNSYYNNIHTYNIYIYNM